MFFFKHCRNKEIVLFRGGSSDKIDRLRRNLHRIDSENLNLHFKNPINESDIDNLNRKTLASVTHNRQRSVEETKTLLCRNRRNCYYVF